MDVLDKSAILAYRKVDMVQAKLNHHKEQHASPTKLVGAHPIFSCCFVVPCVLTSFSLCCLLFLLLSSSSSCSLRTYEIAHQGVFSGRSYPNVSKVTVEIVQGFKGGAEEAMAERSSREEFCKGKYVYMYDVPAQFNEELARECTIAGRGHCAEPWGCLYCGGLENEGFGVQVPKLADAGNSTRIVENGFDYNYSVALEPAGAWYRTHQFSSEVIFHAKMKRYACLTDDADTADAFYVPYYAGQDAAVSMKSNMMQLRDRRVNRFLGWLTGQDTWRKTRGRRHFMVLGRQPLDMNRTIMANMWGLPVTTQPELANVTFLWWEKAFAPSLREIGIPYPTSFHPSSDGDLKVWQERVKGAKREWLVSYLGSAKRKFRHASTLQFRQELKRQCEQESTKCRFMDCTLKYTRWQIPCENEPEIVTLEFSNAIFCLQPEGDTPTRKSIFDSMLAGCIPVVFSNHTAHLQYEAFLPSDPSLYSVFLDRDSIALGATNFVHELASISQEEVRKLQDTIRERILPHIIFSLPSSSVSFHDAFHVALEHLLTGFTS